MSDPAQTPEEDGGPVLARNCTVDAVVAAILLAIGVVVVIEARRLGAGWTTDGPGAGYFPFYIGLIVCISSVGVLAQSLFGKSRDTEAFVDRAQLVRVLSVLLPAALYVLGVVFLGLYVASAIYIALFMKVLGKYAAWKSVLIGVLVNAVFFAMFEVWFKVPLYKGTLEPLRFLGY
ncbi:MAG TPA: tripartite tricarboxylate transporter TctB family protein [Burkholderiaceae bacterium]|nr:tripartite tricarboxylate transporter TctB family protein [Burkholderiaceae bacterium]